MSRSSTRSTARRSSRRRRSRSSPGDQWAYLAGIVAVLLGATLVFFKFPHHDEERRLLEEYHEEDTAATPPAPARGDARPGRIDRMRAHGLDGWT